MSDAATAPLPVPDHATTALGTALKVCLLSELARIDEHLRHRGRHPHAAVHEARKAVRRFRAAAALCAAAAPQTLQQADRHIRSIGKALSGLRDAQVLSETAVAQRRQSQDPQPWLALQKELKKARDVLRERMLHEDPGFGRLRRRATRVAARLADLDFSALGSDAILLALQHSAARMRKAERDASDHPRLRIRHRWRRRVRRLRQQLECLLQIATDEYALPPLRAEARRVLGEARASIPPLASLTALTDYLGSRQDIASLRAALRRLDELPLRDQLLQALKQRRPKPPRATRLSAARNP